MALPAIEFMPGTEDLYFTASPEALRAFIEVNPTVSVAIIGHEGEVTIEQHRTSRNRARAVFEYLVSPGVNANRFPSRAAVQRSACTPSRPLRKSGSQPAHQHSSYQLLIKSSQTGALGYLVHAQIETCHSTCRSLGARFVAPVLCKPLHKKPGPFNGVDHALNTTSRFSLVN